MTPPADNGEDGNPQVEEPDFLATEVAHFIHEGGRGEAIVDSDKYVASDAQARLAELLAELTSSGQYALGNALLDRHIASLQEDFALLMTQEELTAPYDRVETIVALFYATLTDSYIGIDSHKPSRFSEVHPFLLDHLESSVKHAPVSSACHGRKVVRILNSTMAGLTKDESSRGGVFRKYIRWHAENGVTLLRIDPRVASRAQKQFSPSVWTTDVGLWPRAGALLFEPRISKSEQMKLQLSLRQDPDQFGEVIRYVAAVLKGCTELFLDGNKTLRERPMSEELREDLMWSLESIFEPRLAEEWNRFVDSEARLRNREGEVILDLLGNEMSAKNLDVDSLKIFDAAMGVGSETVFLLGQGFTVRSNEIDWTLIEHAKRHAEDNAVQLSFGRFDWRHFEKKLDGEEFDVVLCLGNSLTCLPKPSDMVRALRGMRSLLRKGGMLLIDERNYRDMFSRQEEMLGADFVFPGSVIYCGKTIKAKPLELIGPEDVGKLGYFQDGNLIGTFSVYCYGDGEMSSLLDEAGFDVEQICSDFFAEPNEKAEFITYLARRR